ncbi:MAG: alcohol dehydrogenase catalytic domain-containing protein, partial [Pseudomonadota bacterium]
MPTTARVVVVPEDSGPLTVEQVDLPDPGPFQVVVKQYASGICHSQLHEMHRERQTPVILGHEATGVVLKVGAEVTHVQEGDTVLVTWVPRDVESAARSAEGVTLDLPDGRQAVTGSVFTWADHTLV